MGKFAYILWALTGISTMSYVSYSPPSPGSGSWNVNSYYHGSSSYAGSYGGASAGHK